MIINLFGGPSAGKSTTAHGITSLLKQRGLLCEMASEVAKDIVWRGDHGTLDNQILLFAMQYEKIRLLLGRVDYIVCDSPLLLSKVYDNTGSLHLHGLIDDVNSQFDNFNIFLNRKKAYQPIGRVHSETEAHQLDVEMLDLLIDNNQNYITLDADDNVCETIANMAVLKYEI